jgi:hypothetical protein
MLHLHHPTAATTSTSPSPTDGQTRQPWDDILDLGWAPQFAAGNVLKYLRRHKNPDDRQKAAWYYAALRDLAAPYLDLTISDPGPFPAAARDAAAILSTLNALLTPAERDILSQP